MAFAFSCPRQVRLITFGNFRSLDVPSTVRNAISFHVPSAMAMVDGVPVEVRSSVRCEQFDGGLV